MKCAFIFDPGNADGTKGGAELTLEEFRDSAPEGVEVTDLKDADTVIVGNCVTVSPAMIPALVDRKVWRYHNDLARHENPVLREWLDDNAEHIFTSPMHRERYGIVWDHGEREAHIIPPAVDYSRFKPSRQTKKHRKGIVTVAAWQNPGKGGILVSETLARQELTADCYGPGIYAPRGPHIRNLGEIAPEALPTVLWKYEQFIYLPLSPEPFGRCVAEAWAAGLEVMTNENVGAMWWIENDPDKLATAAEDFWGLITNG